MAIAIVALGNVQGAMAAFDDEFNTGVADPRWTWVDPLADCVYDPVSAPGFLQLRVPGSGHDLDFSNSNAPRLVQPVTGDFIIETKVTNLQYLSPQASGGLLIWGNPDPGAGYPQVRGQALTYGNLSGQLNVQIIKAWDYGSAKGSLAPAVTGDPIWLRMARSGDTLAMSYRTTDADWVTLPSWWSYSVDWPDTVWVGLIAPKMFGDGGLSVDFDYFRFVPEPSTGVGITLALLLGLCRREVRD